MFFQNMDNLHDVPNQLIQSIKGRRKDKRNRPLKRFENVIDKQSSDFDPRFIVSTAVDPYTSFALSESADELFPFIKLLVKFILQSLINCFKFQAKTVSAQVEDPVPSPAKRQRSLFAFGRTNDEQALPPVVQRDTLFGEFKRFLDTCRSDDYLKTAEFWSAHKNVRVM